MREKAMRCMRAVESDSVKSARKARDKLHKACESASEIRERTLHGQEQNRMCKGKRERVTRQSGQHTSTMIRRGFGTSVPFINSTLEETINIRTPAIIGRSYTEAKSRRYWVIPLKGRWSPPYLATEKWSSIVNPHLC